MPPQDNSTGQTPAVDPNAPVQAPVVPEPQAPVTPAMPEPTPVPTDGTGDAGTPPVVPPAA